MSNAARWSCADPSTFFGSVHKKVILDAAKRKGLSVKRISDEHFEISDGRRTHIFFRHAPDTTTFTARLITGSKQATRVCLERAGINVPRGKSFKKSQKDEAWSFAKDLGFPVVVKPINGSGGRGVETNLTTEEAFSAAWDRQKPSMRIVVEKFISGRDYRLFVAGKRMPCAALRVPASVTGDGKNSISELLEIKNLERVRNPYVGEKAIKVSPQMEYELKRRRLSVGSVLPEGRKLRLHSVANIGAGGESVDVTKKVHPQFKKIAIRACFAIPGMSHAGIDLIAEDISVDPKSQRWAVIETNTRPDIALHHFPSRGTPRDAAGALLDFLFPPRMGKVLKQKLRSGLRKIRRSITHSKNRQ